MYHLDNNNNNNNNSILFYFHAKSAALGQITKWAWVKGTHTEYKNEAICNIWLVMKVIKIIIVTKIKFIN
jgi:hypothetical protein